LRHPRPRPGGSPRSIASPASPSDRPSARKSYRRWSGMRALLEFLGIVTPDPARRVPVALPAWVPWVAQVLPVVMALVSQVIYALIRVVLS